MHLINENNITNNFYEFFGFASLENSIILYFFIDIEYTSTSTVEPPELQNYLDQTTLGKNDVMIKSLQPCGDFHDIPRRHS